MSATTEAAHPTVGNERTISVIGLIESDHSPSATSLDFAERVIRVLWDAGAGVFGYRVDWDDNDETAFLAVEAIRLDDEDEGWASPESRWSSVDARIRALTGDGWRAVSCR